MKSRRSWVLLLTVAALATVLLKWWFREKPIEPDWPDNWRPRVVRGQVLRGGEPVDKALVQTDRMAAPVKTGADGRFELPWAEQVIAGVAAPGLGWAAMAECKAESMELSLQPIVRSRGRVVDVRGAPVAGAIVVTPVFVGLGVRRRETGPDGAFDLLAPRGQPVDILLDGPGLLPYVERRFRGGEGALVRVFPGVRVAIAVRDPHGAPLTAETSLELPFLLRGSPTTLATDGAGQLVWVRSDGFLPVQAEVVPHRRAEVILWPERVVTLRVADSVRKRGVPRLAIEVEIHPEGGRWRSAAIVGAPLRTFPLLPGVSGGVYEARLPACPVHLRLTAPGFADAEVKLDANELEKRVWMRPLPRAIGGTMELDGPSDLPVIVTDATGRWRRVVAGDATLEVPVDTVIQIASFGARSGTWLPKLTVKPMKRGERRTVRLHTLPAVRVELDVQPRVDGEVTLTDVAFEALKRPRKLRLRAGKLSVWGRPRRTLRFDVVPDGNHFPVSFEVEVERDGDMRWPIHLREAAGLRYGIRDPAGNPIPFARVRLWEPGRSGQLELRLAPRVTFADWAGNVVMRGLRGGEAALEVAARGYRRRILTLIRAREGETRDGGGLQLEPAGSLEGGVTDYRGKPVPGAWLRVLQPAIRRIPMPGGGERDLYDMVRHSSGTGATDDAGRFIVPDDSARAPLLACYPSARPDLARTPMLIGSDYRLTGVAYVELDAPGSIAGVYQLLPGGRAVLIALDPPLSLRPLPLELPAGRVSLFVRLRDRRWAARELDLRRGEKVRLSPKWRDPLR